jgi:hypothetical protein
MSGSSWVRRVAGSGVTHVAFAFFVMGGWAVVANLGHPMPKPLIAGAVQGVLSATFTLIMKRGIEYLTATLSGLWALFIPPLLAATISACCLSFIHWMAGTPEILATIALPLTVATTYAATYTFTQWKARK